MNEKYFIIAGNLEQAQTFRAKKIQQWVAEQKSVSLSNFILFTSIDQFRGHSKVHGFFCGTFRERADIRDVIRQIRIINNIDPSQMIVPDLFVGRGPVTNPSMPYTNQVMCMVEGITQQPIHDYTATKSGNQVTVEFRNAPPVGTTLSVITLSGVTMLYNCDGFTNKFLFYDNFSSTAWAPASSIPAWSST